jgi:3-hydroxybutyryl-CoA dehydratase
MNEYSYNEIDVGLTEQFKVTVDEAMLNFFLKITGDVNPLHNDSKFAQSKSYPDRIAYGMLTASFLSTLAGVYLPGKNSLIHSVETKFVNPVFIGDNLLIKGLVTEKNDTFQLLVLKVVITNQKNQKVLKGIMKVGVLNE